MVIDNFNQLVEFISNRSFDKTDPTKRNIDYFYFIQILRRRKENPEMSSNNELIKSFYIDGVEELLRIKPKIIRLCEENNARAYIRLNRRSYRVIALRTLEQIAASIATENYNVKRTYESVVGQCHSEPDKTWVVDIDGETHSIDIENTISQLLQEALHEPTWMEVKTKNGIHLITKPFNLAKFKEKHPNIDVHKDNPTILYIP